MAAKQHNVVAIGSTTSDLVLHRQVALDVCLRLGARPLAMESFGASDSTVVDAALQSIDAADIYLGIFGFRYGYIPEGSDISIPELEYRQAIKRQIPRLIFLMGEHHPVQVQDVETGTGAEKLAHLKEAILRSTIVNYFNSVGELGQRIAEALASLRLELSSPKKALLLLPFSPESYALRSELMMILERENLEVIRLDNIGVGARWANTMADAIKSADFIIADATEADANVMYQLGYAHALKKPTLLLADEREFSQLPSDIMSQQVILYDSTRIETLRPHLTRMLRAYAGSGP